MCFKASDISCGYFKKYFVQCTVCLLWRVCLCWCWKINFQSRCSIFDSLKLMEGYFKNPNRIKYTNGLNWWPPDIGSIRLPTDNVFEVPHFLFLTNTLIALWLVPKTLHLLGGIAESIFSLQALEWNTAFSVYKISPWPLWWNNPFLEKNTELFEQAEV